jgi:hypothetical protein
LNRKIEGAITVLKAVPLLVGAERSGTTLLRLMLKGHPQISWQREFELAVDCIGDDGRFPDMQRYYDFLSVSRVFTGDNYAIDKSLSYAELVDSFLVQCGERDARPIVGATCHRHFDRLVHIWPDAKFIHLVRDGRDVGRSAIQMGMTGNLWCATKRWEDAERTWERLKKRLPEDRRIEVRYEDLILNPVDNLRRLCEFIGVSYDPAMEDFYKGTTYDKPDPKLCYQWKKKLSPQDLQICEASVGDLLVERGYELSGQPRVSFGPLQIKRFEWQDRWYRRQVGIRAYGWRISVIGFLARRLGLKALSNRIQLEMNEISNQELK